MVRQVETTDRGKIDVMDYRESVSDIARVKETHKWETGNLTSTPGMQRIMTRNEYERIKSALTFQRENEDGGTDKLKKNGVFLDLNGCVIYCRENNVVNQGM